MQRENLLIKFLNYTILDIKMTESGVSQLNTIRFINSLDVDMKISGMLIHNYTQIKDFSLLMS